MASRKEIKIKSNFSKIIISLSSPENILEQSSGEVLKPETINVIAVNTNVSVTKESFVTVVVWK